MNKMKKPKIWIILLLVLAVLIVAGLIVGTNILNSRFPLKYKEQISEYSTEYELDPYTVSAVIWTESKFVPDVKSSKGATGLMQIMPATGEWIAAKIGAHYDEKLLLEPDYNIRLGCWYLRYLFDKFGDKTLVFAAYNAGPNRVSQWLEDNRYSEDGKTIKKIPFPETDDYILRIDSIYDVYKTFYSFN